MEDGRHGSSSSSKSKRQRSDSSRHHRSSHHSSRSHSFKPVSGRAVSVEEMLLSHTVLGEVGRANSVLYSCCNNDPMAIENTFYKLVTWLKEITKLRSEFRDLEVLVGPLFCHLYLEMSKGSSSKQAQNFFKVHLSCVDKAKCNKHMVELIDAIASGSNEVQRLIENFRSNKVAVNLSAASVKLLTRFLYRNCHVVVLHVLQTWFEVIEAFEPAEPICEEFKVPEASPRVCNGFPRNTFRDVVYQLKKQPRPLYITTLKNLKSDVTCGITSQACNLVIYSRNNGIYVRRSNVKARPGFDCDEIAIRGHPEPVLCMSLIKPLNFLLSSSTTGEILIHDLQNSYRNISTLRGHDYPVYTLASSSNTQFIASGSRDLTTRLWSLQEGSLLKVFAGHKQEVTSVDFHPNSVYLASSSADKTIRIWSTVDHTPLRLLHGSKGAIFNVAFSPKGQYLLSCGEDRRLRIWDIAMGKQLCEVKDGFHAITRVAWSADEKSVFGCSAEGVVKVWDFQKLAKRGSDTGFMDPLFSRQLCSKLLHVEHYGGCYSCLVSERKTKKTPQRTVHAKDYYMQML